MGSDSEVSFSVHKVMISLQQKKKYKMVAIKTKMSTRNYTI